METVQLKRVTSNPHKPCTLGDNIFNLSEDKSINGNYNVVRTNQKLRIWKIFQEKMKKVSKPSNMASGKLKELKKIMRVFVQGVS